jgi:pyruvate,water dikinase
MAIRSSATAEDLIDASFAGQQETYLWILGGEQVMQNLLRCWASLFTPQAIAYRAHRDIPVQNLAMGVVVQCMVPAEAAGVMLTIDPVNGDRSQISIEAAYGLGAAVVNGEVTPDSFGVDKVTLEIRSRSIGTKSDAYRFDPAVQGTRLEPVPPEQQSQPCIDDDEVIQLATLGKRMEQAMGRAQDMEWAIGRGASGEREVFLLQARPETVWSQKPRPPLAAAGSSVMDRILQSMRAPT